MTIKKILCFALACACVATASAQRRTARGSKSAAEEAQDKMDAKVKISQMPSIGPQSLIMAPALSAQGGLQPISKGRRQWGVYDMTYRTAQRWVTRYVNIPEGDHRSCVCLPPSFIERYGEPVVITCEIVTNEGKLLDGETVLSNIGKPFVAGKFTDETKDKAEWWANDEIINAKIQKGPDKGEAFIEVRQGLVDRSKSPFYLVNNADYEAIQ